jgi:hypothetical protein
MASEKEWLLSQIERRAFRPITPFSPKPWVQLSVHHGRPARAWRISREMDIQGEPLKIGGEQGINGASGKEETIPFPSGEIGSLFVLMSPCPSRRLKRLLQEAHRVLKGEGRILIGFVPRSSFWGNIYFAQEKGGASAGPRRLRPHSLKEMEHRVMQAGFSLQGISSTLFQQPGKLKVVENPMIGYRPQAGYLVLIGEKMGGLKGPSYGGTKTDLSHGP